MKLLLGALTVLTLVLALFCAYLIAAENRERSVRMGVENQITRLAESVDRMTRTMEQVLRERNLMEPGQLYASWYSAGTPPVLREVITTRLEGETVRSWEDRHDAAVASLRTTYPPV